MRRRPGSASSTVSGPRYVPLPSWLSGSGELWPFRPVPTDGRQLGARCLSRLPTCHHRSLAAWASPRTDAVVKSAVSTRRLRSLIAGATGTETMRAV